MNVLELGKLACYFFAKFDPLNVLFSYRNVVDVDRIESLNGFACQTPAPSGHMK